MKKLLYILFFISCGVFAQHETMLLASQQQFANEGGYDVDAQAYIDAVTTLTTAEEIAINDLVLGLKSNGTWSELVAIYPYIGGTSAEHKWNLKDPRDLDAAYRLTFNGTITHNANGITGNGTTGYADTHLNPTTVLTSTSNSLGTYLLTDVAEESAAIGIYIPGGGENYFSLFPRWSDNNFYSWQYTSSSSVSAAVGNSNAFFQVSQNGATSHKVWKDASQFSTTDTDDSTSQFSNLNYNFFICAQSNEGVAVSHSTRTHAFDYIGDGLTDSDLVNINTVVQAYQTALGRNN